MGALFDGVKERVTAKDAAGMYIGIDRHGRAKCPWHADTHPSLSFDKNTGRCKCFACNNGGSAIDLVMRVFDLSPLEAAKKINADFALGLDASLAPPPRGKTRGQWQKEYEEWFRDKNNRLHRKKWPLVAEQKQLEKQVDSFKPDNLDNNPDFDAAIEAIAKVVEKISRLDDEINQLEGTTLEDYKQLKGG